MNLQLKGKSAFISGSTRGIGFSIANQLLQEGADVIINGRNAENVQQVIEQLQKQFPESTITGIAADFANKKEVASLLSKLSDIDILINNVGIFGIDNFCDTTDENWYHYFEINVMSGMRLSRILLPAMLKKTGEELFSSAANQEKIYLKI